MVRTVLMIVVVGLVVAMAASTGLASTVTRAADRLVADQISSSDSTNGSWPEEPNFAGESIIGLCHAYEWTNDSDYKDAAEIGGAYSLNEAGYNPSTGGFTSGLFPTEMYAMARLSAIQADPDSNVWRTALVNNLNHLNPVTVIPWFQNDENARDSDAVYDMARLAVAANYADHASKTAWRDGVLTLLADVDSYDAAPVMALGSAVWALGVTDDISTDTDDISTDTRVVWPGVQVKDLPVELASWQAPDNSFYTKFDIDLGEGFTETTAMGALGLMAAYTSSASYSYASEIVLAANVLRAGVSDPDGEDYRANNAPMTGDDYFAAGET